MNSIDFVQDATRLHVEKVATEKVNRAWDVNAVSSIQKTLSERRYSSAGAISRKSLYEGVSAVCNASLASAVNILYERVDNRLCNVDKATWRILVPLPWGSAGHRHYGLRSTEAGVLRAVMLARIASVTDGHINLFIYDDDRRSWLLNLADYRAPGIANAYLDRWPVTAGQVASTWGDVMQRKMAKSRR